MTFEVEGEKQVAVELGITADKVKDFRTPLKQIGGELLKSFDINFASRGALFQGGWPPRKGDYPWPILEKSGRLRRGFRQKSLTSDTVVLDNPVPYFPYHQSNQPRRRLPRRVMMKIDSDRRNFIVKAFQRHIVESTRGFR